MTYYETRKYCGTVKRDWEPGCVVALTSINEMAAAPPSVMYETARNFAAQFLVVERSDISLRVIVPLGWDETGRRRRVTYRATIID